MLVVPTSLSLAAAGVYVAVMAGCLWAARASGASRNRASDVYSWLFLGAFFGLLAVTRVIGFEDLVREELRTVLFTQEAYEQRREIQRPLAAGAVLIFAPLTFWWVYRTARTVRSRSAIALSLAYLGAIGMTALLVLRIVSLHDVDRLLYGPLKLNWIGDVGFAVTVFAAAVYYGKRAASRRVAG